jgi:hypothetical protein
MSHLAAAMVLLLSVNAFAQDAPRVSEPPPPAQPYQAQAQPYQPPPEIPPPVVAPPPYAYPPPQPFQPYYGNPYQQQPPAIRYKTQPIWGLVIAGLSVWFVAYVSDIIGTYAFGHEPGWKAFIPVAGPVVQMTTDRFSSTWEGLAYVALGIDFFFQFAGFTMAIIGGAVQKKVPVRVEAGRGMVFTF